MVVRTNHESRHVTISGRDGSGWYEVTLTWSQAANLASLLNQASREIEPVLNFGRVYRPAIER
ncbi:hypothetical protein [Nitrospira sp. Nam80]